MTRLLRENDDGSPYSSPICCNFKDFSAVKSVGE